MSDLGRDAKNLIDLARDGDEPTVADRTRLRQQLALRIGVAAATGTGAALATKTTAAAAAKSVATGAAVASSTAGAGAVASTTWVAGASLATKFVATVLVAGAVTGGAALFTRGEQGARAPSSPQAPTAVTALASTASQAGANPAPAFVAPGPTVAEAVTPTMETSAPVAQAVPKPIARVASLEQAPPLTEAARPVTTQVVAPKSPSTLDQETRLLRSAQVALDSGDAALALSLLGEHARTFPTGMLSEERRAQRIFALCSARRDTEARAEAQRFVTESPRSPLLPRVRESCGGK